MWPCLYRVTFIQVWRPQVFTICMSTPTHSTSSCWWTLKFHYHWTQLMEVTRNLLSTFRQTTVLPFTSKLQGYEYYCIFDETTTNVSLVKFTVGMWYHVQCVSKRNFLLSKEFTFFGCLRVVASEIVPFTPRELFQPSYSLSSLVLWIDQMIQHTHIGP